MIQAGNFAREFFLGQGPQEADESAHIHHFAGVE
jgi:hypothetical protein